MKLDSDVVNVLKDDGVDTNWKTLKNHGKLSHLSANKFSCSGTSIPMKLYAGPFGILH